MLPELIARLRETIPPSEGDSLLGFKMDCDVFFAEDPLIDEVAVARTTDPSELLRIRVRLALNAATLQDVSRALTTAWQNVAYSEFQATSLEWFQEAIVLRFVTVISGARFFVSGCTVATGPTYPSLVSAFHRDFGSLRRPLRHLPDGIPAWAI
jgi:hypothetical protein